LFFIAPDELSPVINKALSGDLVFAITPAVAIRPHAATSFARQINVTLQDAAGDVHTWYNGNISVSASDASFAGVASTPSATVPMVNGVATVVLNGTTAAWLAGVNQVETATAAGTVSTAGNAAVTVTAAGLTGSPKAYSVPVALNDTATLVAGKIAAVLATDTALTALYTVTNPTGAPTTVVLTATSAVANDSTLNVAIATGTAVGITAAASSANTTAGSAAETNTLTVAASTILGYTVASKTSVETIV